MRRLKLLALLAAGASMISAAERPRPNERGKAARVLRASSDASPSLSEGGDAPSAARRESQTQLPKSQVPTLGRPTKPDDPAPLLDFAAYFNGTWHFTWDFPESPLGAAGSLTGTTTYKALSPTTFEALSNATAEGGGAVTLREVITYQREERTLSREVTDSRGFKYKQTGTVAGDLGGQFTIRLESEPFVHNGRTIRLKSVQRLLSPHNFRTQTTIGVDDGPFENYGNPWWKKNP